MPILPAVLALALAAPPHGLRVPDGFEVAEFADHALANDVYCLTLDAKGRVFVSGRGYVRRLVDTDGDGKADKTVTFADSPRDGAMGLLWEGDSLYCTGDGGLRRYRDSDGDGKADGPPELLLKLKTGGEHDAHAVVRGPDGWLYVLCGNGAKVDKSHASLPTSPIKEPVAGCVLRLPPDLKGSEIVADGFRNPYGMDFNPDGELFAYDSDNERCVSLPWYEYTRCYHVVPGGHHGWQSPHRADTWRMPPYFLDVTPPLATLGRGSPTGVVCYRHTQFPVKYRGGLFLLDWTFGRIHFLPLTRSGSTYNTRPEVFAEAVGDNGFAPTSVAVDPTTGDLYVSIGGRGTRGAVYRVRHTKGYADAKPNGVVKLAARSLEKPREPAKVVEEACGADLHARRRALEAMARWPEAFTSAQRIRATEASAGEEDRGLRQAVARLLTRAGDDVRRPADGWKSPRAITTADLSRVLRDPAAVREREVRLAADGHALPDVRLAAIRLVQLSLGGLTARKAHGTTWEGYTPRDEKAALTPDERARLRKAFPTGEADLDRELARTLAIVEDDDPALVRVLADRLTDRSNPLDDIHYLLAMARLKGERGEGVTARTAAALLALDAKVVARKLTRDRHWPLRVAELHAELARKDAALNKAILDHRDFGRPDHALFARCPGFDRKRAAEVFLDRAARSPDYAWNAELVGVVGDLPAEKGMPVLRKLWGEAGLDDAILPVLARDPQAEDRPRFVAGLGSATDARVSICLDALAKLPARDDPDEVLQLVLALRRVPDDKDNEKLRDRLAARLSQVTGETKPGKDREAWAAWFARKYPDKAGRVADPDGVDVAAWSKRLAAIDWSAGDAARGQAVYTKASCASCHSGSQALGPDLAGVAGRFSRDDLFTALLRPSKDVSPRYRTTQIVTDAGKVYQGLVVYEAVDSLILQTGPATTQRLIDAQISSRRLTASSLMPAGLLDRLTDAEIADLYAYLKGLTSKGNGGP